jgi:hypothetical protein
MDTYFQISHGGIYSKKYLLRTLLASVAPTAFISLSVSLLSVQQLITNRHLFPKYCQCAVKFLFIEFPSQNEDSYEMEEMKNCLMKLFGIRDPLQTVLITRFFALSSFGSCFYTDEFGYIKCLIGINL